jgi:hypothetical protein
MSLMFFPGTESQLSQDTPPRHYQSRLFEECVKSAIAIILHPPTPLSESSDPEFDDYNRHFAVLEQATEKLLKDTKVFTDAVTGTSNPHNRPRLVE